MEDDFDCSNHHFASTSIQKFRYTQTRGAIQPVTDSKVLNVRMQCAIYAYLHLYFILYHTVYPWLSLTGLLDSPYKLEQARDWPINPPRPTGSQGHGLVCA